MSDKHPPRRALGRGLEALLPARPAPGDDRFGPRAVFTCPIERIVPRRDQPRQSMPAEALDELAATIARVGVIQPLVVRRLGEDRFEIIAGERRWRAAQRAGLKEVQVVVKDVSPEHAFVLALIENLHRANLNAIEQAVAFSRLVEEHGFTQEQVAEQVGKSRAAVTNALRLLKLPERVRLLVSTGQLSEGHGRALLGAPDDPTVEALASRAVRGQLSVRKVEQLVRQAARPRRRPGAGAAPGAKSAGVRDLEERLTRALGARTRVEHLGPGGTVVVSYADLDELDRIIERLGA